MLVARDIKEHRREAWRTEKGQGPFACPACQGEVILRKGKVRQHHFAHHKTATCAYGKGESQTHMLVKRSIYEALEHHPACTDLALERHLGAVRPDVSGRINGQRVVIEVQRSGISPDLIAHRMREYRKLDAAVVWVLTCTRSDLARPSHWQRYLHAMYWGRLYIWMEGAVICSIHLNPAWKWVESSSYYDSMGNEINHGGYHRRSKREANPLSSEQLHLADDFQASSRKSWRSKNMDIPASLLWMDDRPTRWSAARSSALAVGGMER